MPAPFLAVSLHPSRSCQRCVLCRLLPVQAPAIALRGRMNAPLRLLAFDTTCARLLDLHYFGACVRTLQLKGRSVLSFALFVAPFTICSCVLVFCSRGLCGVAIGPASPKVSAVSPRRPPVRDVACARRTQSLHVQHACTRTRTRTHTRVRKRAPTLPRAFRLRGRSGLASLRAQAPPAAGARLCGFGCVFTCMRMCDGVCARTQGVCVCMCVCMCMCMCMCVCARAYAYVVMRAACERAQATYKGTYKAVKPWFLAWFLACRILSFCVCRILLLITPVLWRVVFFYDACVEF